MTGHFCPDDLTKVSKSTGRKRHTNHLKEPSEEPYNSESVKRAATEFDEWYRHYPRKVARGAAEKAYRTARKEVSADVLLAGVLQYAAQRQGKNPEYTPYPATWLNSRRWTDEPPAPSQQMSILEIVQSAVSNADQLFRNDDTPGILDLDAEELP